LAKGKLSFLGSDPLWKRIACLYGASGDSLRAWRWSGGKPFLAPEAEELAFLRGAVLSSRDCTSHLNTDCRGGSMLKKLLGALTLATFLCVSGAAFAQDAAKPDDTKKEESKDKKKMKKDKKKKEEKKEEKKDKPS